MHGRAAPRKAVPRWSAQDPHGDSEIPRPTDEVLPATPVNTPAPSDDDGLRPEFWHG